MRASRSLRSILPYGLAAWLALGLVSSPALAEDAQEAKPAAGEPLRVLIFSGTGWYRHPEIPRSADWHNHDRSVSGRPGFQVLMRLDTATIEDV
jgi:hypothetical protein